MTGFICSKDIKIYASALFLALGLLQLPSHAYAAQDFSTVQRNAGQGNAMAQYDLGSMYITGDGVPQDEEKAFFWYRKAAEQGNARAQGMLASLYSSGKIVAKSQQQAVFWYRKSAEQGDAISQGELGKYYARGEGVPQNFSIAYVWLSVATANGATHVTAARDLTAAALSGPELSAAQKLAGQYFEKYRSR